MEDRTLPIWLKAVLVVMAVMQLIFGLTLLLNPGALTSMWPWPMTAVTTRLLGSSTLVSVPLALLSVWFDRFSVARIPMVMMLTYRVMQICAGLAHLGRFDFTSPTTWNYFGGGSVALVVLLIGLLRGASLGRPVTGAHSFLRGSAKLNLDRSGTLVFNAMGVLFVILGVLFFLLGDQAGFMWFEAGGNLTSLTARLFASPMLGLGLALLLIARAHLWRAVFVPAVGMITFGAAGILTLLLESASVQPPTAFGYFIIATPVILLILGLYLILPNRSILE